MLRWIRNNILFPTHSCSEFEMNYKIFAMQEFYGNIGSLSDEEIGQIYARSILVRSGWLLDGCIPLGCFDEFGCNIPSPNFVRELEINFETMMSVLLKENNFPDAIPLRFWQCTFWGIYYLRLRTHGKLIWDEVDRGRIYVMKKIHEAKFFDEDITDEHVEWSKKFSDFRPECLKKE